MSSIPPPSYLRFVVVILMRFYTAMRKWDGALRDDNQMARFHDALDSCGLEDLDYQGPDYTWASTRLGGGYVRCLLDKVVASHHLQQLFPWSKVIVCNGPLSNHCALILQCLR